MSHITLMPTEYKGYIFRSKLEAKWAVFFDACGVNWEYKPELYDLGDGLYYSPDFLLYGVAGRCPNKLYVEVKREMSDVDIEKIFRFTGIREFESPANDKIKNPVLIVNQIPTGESVWEIDDFCRDRWCDGLRGIKNKVNPFCFGLIDGDDFALTPGVNQDGRFELFGDESHYTCDRNDRATLQAYRLARRAVF